MCSSQADAWYVVPGRIMKSAVGRYGMNFGANLRTKLRLLDGEVDRSTGALTTVALDLQNCSRLKAYACMLELER